MSQPEKVALLIGDLQLRNIELESKLEQANVTLNNTKQEYVELTDKYNDLVSRFNDLNGKSALILQARNSQLEAAQNEIRELRKQQSANTNVLIDGADSVKENTEQPNTESEPDVEHMSVSESEPE